jgi:hypothetical protein
MKKEFAQNMRKNFSMMEISQKNCVKKMFLMLKP